ncbi:MAG: DUF2007 domain-containing protein [Bacteroidales bacterium]|nr:DUF2007 domain-containing protein [Bacteroidales bacterium]
MHRDWVTVFSTDLLYKAELAINVLQNSNIEAVIFNTRDSTYNSFGEIEVKVPKEHIMKASALLNNL